MFAIVINDLRALSVCNTVAGNNVIIVNTTRTFKIQLQTPSETSQQNNFFFFSYNAIRLVAYSMRFTNLLYIL